MRHNDVIYLIKTQIVEDELGNQIPQEIERQVFANRMSVTQEEFYNAAVTGLRPQKMWEIYAFEYDEEMKVRHEGEKYNIIRTQERGEKLRLVCERVAADG